MIPDHSHHLSGALVERDRRAISRAELQTGHITFRAEIPKSRWEEYVFRSSVALQGEEHDGLAGPFFYRVVSRRSGPRIALLSESKAISQHLIEKELADLKLRRVPINVNRLVRAITEKPTEYALSFTHARLPAYGTSLQAASFYGHDIAEAQLFRESIDVMDFFVCGLRHASGRTELLRLSGDGSISFFYSSPDRILEVEHVLKYLRQEGYLPESIWSDHEGGV